MGCCISKFTPETKKFTQEEEEEYSYVQDKLVVSHYQNKACPVLVPEKKQLVPIPDKVFHIHISDKFTAPPPPPSKLSSLSPTLTSSASNASHSSSSSSLSTSSSVLSVPKNRSFTDELPHACRHRGDPHVVRINSLMEASLSQKSSKPSTPTRSNSPVRTKRYPSTPNRSNPDSRKGSSEGGSPLQNGRIRVNSPNPRPLTWQKSFREDQERVIPTKSGRFLKSPSPSRRFGMAGSRVNPISLDLQSSKTNLRNRSETRIHRIDSEIDENTVKEVITNKNERAVSTEEIENPLISLECFIFL